MLEPLIIIKSWIGLLTAVSLLTLALYGMVSLLLTLADKLSDWLF